MGLGDLDVLVDVLQDLGAQLGLAQVGAEVDAHPVGPLEQLGRLHEVAGLAVGDEAVEGLAHQKEPGLGRKDVDQRDPGPLGALADLADGGLDGPGRDRHLVACKGRAGHAHHEGQRVAEVGVEVDGPRAVRQLQGLQLDVDVVPDLGRVAAADLIDLQVDLTEARTRDRLDGGDLVVLLDDVLDLLGDEELDFLGVIARPLAHDARLAHRHVGVLALGHHHPAAYAPDHEEHEHHPGDLRILHAEPRQVVRVL